MAHSSCDLAVAPERAFRLASGLSPYIYWPRRGLYGGCSGISSLPCEVREDLAVARVEGLPIGSSITLGVPLA